MLCSIETSPPEVIEQVVQHLSLQDIQNLRLGSRQLAALATQHTFKLYFVNKTVRIAKADLDGFVKLSKPGGLGCLVENLTLTGVAIDITLLQRILKAGAKWVTESDGPMSSSTQHKCTRQELAKIKEDILNLETRIEESVVLKETGVYTCVLGKALRNVAAHGKLRKLQTLKLDVVVLRENAVTEASPLNGGDWKIIWEAASDCFDIAMTSLAGSKVRVGKLDAFKTSFRCSLGLDKLKDIETAECGLAESLHNSTSLSLSVSDRVLSASELEGTAEELRALRMQQTGFEGLGRLTRLTQKLEALHLHWFNTFQQRGNSEELNEIFNSRGRSFGTFAETAYLPWLNTSALRGVYVTEETLLTVLRSAPIKDFSMEETKMRDGTFRPIFDHCTSSEASMQRLFFDDLWERKIVMFEDEGKLKFPYSQRWSGGPTLERTGGEVGKPIRYGNPNGYVLGSPQAYMWREKRRQDYGPP
ncbi:hypothetical protein PMIN03_010753 [Paraphaeosphaeria minitans]